MRCGEKPWSCKLEMGLSSGLFVVEFQTLTSSLCSLPGYCAPNLLYPKYLASPEIDWLQRELSDPSQEG